jgi:hypothetical protein
LWWKIEDRDEGRKDRGLMVVDIVSVKGAVNTHYQIRLDLSTRHSCCEEARKRGRRSELGLGDVVRSEK